MVTIQLGNLIVKQLRNALVLIVIKQTKVQIPVKMFLLKRTHQDEIAW
jgi:hypothetical protein